MNDVHAGGVKGGIADSSPPETPLDTSRARLGNNPLADQGPSKSQVAESNPMMTIFGTFMSLINSFPAAPRSDEKNSNGAQAVQARSNTGSGVGLQSLDSRVSDKGVHLSQKTDKGGSS